MKHQNQSLTTLQFYKNTTSLDTSSYSRFTISVFQDVPKWFWGYIIVVSLFFALVMGNDAFFIPLSAPPTIQPLTHVYTFIVIFLLPMALTYIRFVKSFSFTSLYMKLARTDSKLTERHNRHVRAEKNKVYIDDHYHFTYNNRSGRWHGQNVDAERRNQRSEWGDMSWFIRLGYPGFLCFFLLIYIGIMYLIVIPVMMIIALHIYYKYKQIKRRRHNENMA
ncbi:hypothetical protein [Staphylococcus epidermidis]|uniref:hypothetical protein n=1 Tax=Staphylococcus epidermidis TaxID=1282 RepID=UPI001E3B15F0|nr:hypothetical protein [Staphylococcus epidermidis]MCD8926357.1 hypothetical protein [Staphylococcus epidermidis]